MNKFMNEPVVDECEGCSRIESDGFCTVYAWPEVHWVNGKRCPMATHIEKAVVEKTKMLDPIKASKRKHRGK
jgi:hypothetical protein